MIDETFVIKAKNANIFIRILTGFLFVVSIVIEACRMILFINLLIRLFNKNQTKHSARKQTLAKPYRELNVLFKYFKYYHENKKEIHKAAQGYLYLLPALVLMIVFTIYPLVNTFIMSFQYKLNYMTGVFQGWTLNYYKEILIPDPYYTAEYGLLKGMWLDTQTGFYRPLLNTIIIVVTSVPISVLLALFIAVLLNSVKKLQGLYQTIFFLPYVTNVIAIGMVFSMMFNTNEGIINRIFGSMTNWNGAGASNFHILFTLIVYLTWNGLPFKILIFLSGIQGIDKQYYQAAQIDATPRYRVFRRITVPMLSPFILFIMITSFMGAFKVYSEVIAMFGQYAGPDGNSGAASTIVYFAYTKLADSKLGEISLASAASVILFIIILIFTLIQMQVAKKRVYY